MAKIIKSEFLGAEHPIFGGEWTISSYKKRTPEQEAKNVESMKNKYASLIATELTLSANLDEE